LVRVVAGEYEAPKPARPRERPPTSRRQLEDEDNLSRLQRALDREEWDEALALLDQIIEAEPQDNRYPMLALFILISQLGDVERATEWGLNLVEKRSDDPEFLNELSWRLLTAEDYGARCMELAYKAARAAYEAGGRDRADITDTLARALYQIGRIDEAIRLQERAVALAEEQDEEGAGIEQMRATLRYYRDCATVRNNATPLGR
jgi:tetratricopeptide (TPR) repeat protein